MRFAVALHVVEKNDQIAENLICLDSESNIWETKYWVIGKSTRAQLLSGKVYVHRGQKVPSHAGGTVLRIYKPDEDNHNRYSVVFKAEEDCKNVVAPSTGWGNEKRIEWLG
jgi:hypothetical protein